jgi:hypothetical protein
VFRNVKLGKWDGSVRRGLGSVSQHAERNCAFLIRLWVRYLWRTEKKIKNQNQEKKAANTAPDPGATIVESAAAEKKFQSATAWTFIVSSWAQAPRYTSPISEGLYGAFGYTAEILISRLKVRFLPRSPNLASTWRLLL